MPIPWLAVLQSVPWSDVLSNAPKVADGAKKLWKTIGKKSPVSTTDATDESPSLAPEAQSISTLHARLLKMEAGQVELHNQMFDSSELIKALAEQNALLIARADAMRVRVFRMQVAIAVVAIIAITGLTLVAGR